MISATRPGNAYERRTLAEVLKNPFQPAPPGHEPQAPEAAERRPVGILSADVRQSPVRWLKRRSS